MTIRKISVRLGIGIRQIRDILHDCLGVSKISARCTVVHFNNLAGQKWRNHMLKNPVRTEFFYQRFPCIAVRQTCVKQKLN